MWVVSAQIMLFLKLQKKIPKKVSFKQKIVKENGDSFEMFKSILFFK
jgi:hypothetical protein